MRIIAVLLLLLCAGGAHAHAAAPDCSATPSVAALEAAATVLPGAVLHAAETTTGIGLERGSRLRSGQRRALECASALPATIPVQRRGSTSDGRARFAPSSLALRSGHAAWLTTRPPPAPQH